jgi:RNA polymerase sigma-70 factor (ECF subfamily)
MDEDVLLIDEALGGCEIAFGRLVGKYRDRLRHAMVPLAGSREDADDVVQKALVRAFFKLHRFHALSTFYTWLYRIAMNEAANHRYGRRPTLSLEQMRERGRAEPTDGRPEPPEQLEQQHRCRQIHEAIAGLSPEQRDVLELRAFDRCSYETIAEILGLPVSTVRGRLSMARGRLRKELRPIMV